LAAAVFFIFKSLKTALWKKACIAIIVVLTIGGGFLYYTFTRTENNVKRLFIENRSLYEDLVNIALAKEPYLSVYSGNQNAMEIEYIDARVVRDARTANPEELNDEEFASAFRALIEKCYVSSLFVSKSEIGFKCNLPQVTITFVYSPIADRKELNRLQSTIDDYWFMDWFAGA
jgi:hypothetical protein